YQISLAGDISVWISSKQAVVRKEPSGINVIIPEPRPAEKLGHLVKKRL
ncbi:hypothetical protein Avbf_05794, partial [Armadillidium vulgare]